MRASTLRQLIREMLGKSTSDELQDLVRGDQHLRTAWGQTVAAEGGFNALGADKSRWDAVQAAFIEEHGTSADDMFGDKSRHRRSSPYPIDSFGAR